MLIIVLESLVNGIVCKIYGMKEIDAYLRDVIISIKVDSWLKVLMTLVNG